MYEDAGVKIPVRSTTYVEGKKLPNENDTYEIVLSVSNMNTSKVHGELIRLKKGSKGCITNVTLKYMNQHWQRLHGSKAREWLKN